MAISAFKGPIVSYGSQPNADSSEWEGPDVNNAGQMQQDPRIYTSYAGGNWVAGWFQSGRGFVTVDCTTGAANATCLAATQSAATAMVLASANNSSSQVVVNATAINVNTGAVITGLVAIGCPDATATSQFLAFGQSGTNGTSGVNCWDPAHMYARNVTVTAAGTDTGRTVTVAGNDIYGVPMTEQIAVANTSGVAGAKAFKYIRSATLDALPTGGISIGCGTLAGLPLRCDTPFYLTAYNSATALTACTAAVTAAATATTGDVRGTVVTASAATKLVIFQAIPASSFVSLSTGTNSGLVGVAQA